MIASTTKDQLQHCLNSVNFPASRNDVLAAAIRGECDLPTLKALRALAPITYANADQVRASITLSPAADNADGNGPSDA